MSFSFRSVLIFQLTYAVRRHLEVSGRTPLPTSGAGGPSDTSTRILSTGGRWMRSESCPKLKRVRVVRGDPRLEAELRYDDLRGLDSGFPDPLIGGRRRRTKMMASTATGTTKIATTRRVVSALRVAALEPADGDPENVTD